MIYIKNLKIARVRFILLLLFAVAWILSLQKIHAQLESHNVFSLKM